MDKQQIIRKLLENGLQTNEVGLHILVRNPSLMLKILSLPTKPTTLTEEFLKHLGEEPHIIKPQPLEHQIKIEDIHRRLKQKYEILKKSILEIHPELENLISINRINEKTKTFSIIGVVSEIGEDLVLEDSTGIERFGLGYNQPLTEDEIICVVCERENGKNIVKKIVYPDIPLKRTISKTESEEFIIFTSNISPKNNTSYENFLTNIGGKHNLKIIFLDNNTESDIIQVRNDIPSATYFVTTAPVQSPAIYPNPVYLEINNLKIFLTSGEFLEEYIKKWNTSLEDTIITLIQKRHLNPSARDVSNNTYLLDIIPDIIVVGNCNDIVNTNYKGTTILTTGSLKVTPMYWLLNTKTRETFKTDFP